MTVKPGTEENISDARLRSANGDVAGHFGLRPLVGTKQFTEVLNRAFETILQANLRSPLQVTLRQTCVGLSLLRVVQRQIHLDQPASTPRNHPQNQTGEFPDGELVRIAEVDWANHVRLTHHATDSFDEIIDVLEATRLRAITVDRDVLPLQRLHDEVGDHAPVIRVHVWTVGVEDSNHPNINVLFPIVVEEQALRIHLADIVARADARDVDVPTIILRLRVDKRVAVHLAGGCL